MSSRPFFLQTVCDIMQQNLCSGTLQLRKRNDYSNGAKEKLNRMNRQLSQHKFQPHLLLVTSCFHQLPLPAHIETNIHNRVTLRCPKDTLHFKRIAKNESLPLFSFLQRNWFRLRRRHFKNFSRYASPDQSVVVPTTSFQLPSLSDTLSFYHELKLFPTTYFKKVKVFRVRKKSSNAAALPIWCERKLSKLLCCFVKSTTISNYFIGISGGSKMAALLIDG